MGPPLIGGCRRAGQLAAARPEPTIPAGVGLPRLSAAGSASLLVPAGGVRPDRRELHLDEGLDDAAHVGPVFAGEHADAGLQAGQQGAVADAGDDHGVDHVGAEREYRRHAAAVPVGGVLDDVHAGDLAVDEVDEGEGGAASEVPGAGGVETAGRLGRHGETDAVRGTVGHVVQTFFR